MTAPLSQFFPKADAYTDLLEPTGNRVRETVGEETAFAYTERHLQCAWYDPLYRPARLLSSEGEKVVVQDPGRWNLEAGPDLLDATLIIGPQRRRRRGDIEIHIRPQDWTVHGHRSDPAYAGVIAHVSYLPGVLPESDLPAGTVQISIRDALAANPAFSFDGIDITAYPYASPTGKPRPCGDIVASWPPAERAALLEMSGQQRLKEKAARMSRAIADRGPEQALYEGIMLALGYKRNRIPFDHLARRLSLQKLREEANHDATRAYALLLGVAGLMPARLLDQWDAETRTFIRRLWDHWWKQESRWNPLVIPRSVWQLSGIRPQNSPLRRLAAAADLFTNEAGPISKLSFVTITAAKPWFKEAEALFQSSGATGYWKNRLTFSAAPQKKETALIGRQRIGAILSNAVIPHLAATGVDTTPLLSQVPPEHDNNILRQTAFALFGRDHNPALYRDGLQQQGLLQIFHDFCLNNKTGCSGCRLTSALTAHAKAASLSESDLNPVGTLNRRRNHAVPHGFPH